MSNIADQKVCEIDFSTQSGAEAIVRKILRIPQVEKTAPQERKAERLFSFAMLVSALRCTLSYVILPFVLPALGLGAAVGVGPDIGIPVGIVALYFDIKGIRRFWIAGHKWRWQMSLIYLLVIGLVTYLVVGDIAQLIK